MTAAGLLTTLTAWGFTLRADAGTLWVSPAERLLPAYASYVRQHKQGLLALLADGAGPTGAETLPPPREISTPEASPVSVSVPIAEKVTYVRSQGQTRSHHCHWPGCARQVPPAQWGCRQHWFALPKAMRDRIWRAYEPGQEVDGTPSREYVTVAREVQDWIAEHHPTTVAGITATPRRPETAPAQQLSACPSCRGPLPPGWPYCGPCESYVCSGCRKLTGGLYSICSRCSLMEATRA